MHYCSLPELLKEFFIRGKRSVVVTGTHGKTTTSSLLAWVFEHHGARVRRARSELALLAAREHARVVALDDERSHRTAELREHDRDVRDPAVRDVDLLAVQDVVVAVASGLGTDRREVCAGVRFRERDRGERPLLACEHTEVALALFVGPELAQRPDREHRRLDRPRERRASPRELFGDEGRRHRVRTAAAVFGGNRVRREPHAGGLREQLGRELLALVAFPRDGTQLTLCELAREGLQLALLVRELEGDHSVTVTGIRCTELFE